MRVLLRIEHLEHRRRRVAAIVAGELVDLVEQDHRVDGLGRLHRVDDPARHGADVGAAVTTDLGLVAHTAQADADELATHRLGDRAAKARLADARRAGEAEDLGRGGDAGFLRQAAHGEELDNAFLDLVEAVMVLVEALFRRGEVDPVLRDLGPREGEHGLDIGADDRGFGGDVRHALETLDLAKELLLRVVRHAALVDLGAELLELVTVFAAQLALDNLQLLGQVVLTLGLIHLLVDAVLDAAVQLGDLDLVREHAAQALEAVERIRRLQQLLPLRHLADDLRRQEVGEMPGIRGALDHVQHLGRKIAVDVGVLKGQVLDLADHRRRFIRVDRRFDDVFRRRHEERSLVLDIEQAEAADAFEHDLEIASRLSIGGKDAAEGAYLEKILRARVVDLLVTVCRDGDHPARHHRFLNGMDGARAPDLQGHDIAWEDDDLAERQQRDLGGGLRLQSIVQPLELSHATTVSP